VRTFDDKSYYLVAEWRHPEARQLYNMSDTNIRPQFSHRIKSSMLRISTTRCGGIMMEQPEQAPLITCATPFPSFAKRMRS
jgi:hypothetical protein